MTRPDDVARAIAAGAGGIPPTAGAGVLSPFTTSTDPVAIARVMGHDLGDDPPAALSSMRRHTCGVCGRAVLIRPDGTGYGSATTTPCAAGEDR